MNTNRICKFDNIKFICIILVIVGHLIEHELEYSPAFVSLFLVIYSFHMPVFIFINGLFQKRFDRGAAFSLQRFTFFIVIAYLLKLLIYLVRYFNDDYAKIEWFGGQQLSWYLIVIALYMLLAYGIRKIKVKPIIIILLSVVLSCICGYFDFINDFLWLSRFFVFLPFYLAGYYLTPEKVIEVTNIWYIRLSSVVLSCVYVGLCFWNVNIFYPLRRLFTGRNPYSVVTAIDGCNLFHRLFCYVIMVILLVGIISLVPNRKIPVITHLGLNTISAFFWHRIVMYILDYTGVMDSIRKLPHKIWAASVLAIGVAMGIIFMLDPVQYPLKKLNGLLKKSSNKACIVILLVIIAIGIVFSCFEGVKIF